MGTKWFNLDIALDEVNDSIGNLKLGGLHFWSQFINKTTDSTGKITGINNYYGDGAVFAVRQTALFNSTVAVVIIEDVTTTTFSMRFRKTSDSSVVANSNIVGTFSFCSRQ